MKTLLKLKTLTQLVVLGLFLLLSGLSCEKEYPPGTPEIYKLPPITQTGADTFGCLVDGKAFTPKGTWGSSGLQLYYQYVNNAYHFNIGVTRNEINAPLRGMQIRSHGIQLEVKNYELTEPDLPLSFGAFYTIYPDYAEIDKYQTNSMVKGEITISRFDLANQIVSGTFWFDAINKDGKTVQVREGRFDSHFVL